MSMRLTFFRNESGVAAVEFALIAPVFLLLMAGILDYGLMINYQMKLQDLSRTAAQYVVQGGSDADVMEDIIETSDFYQDSVAKGQDIILSTDTECECGNGVSMSCALSCPSDGDYLRSFYIVTLTSTYQTLFPYPGLDDSITVNGYSRLQYNLY
jgi:hypothetical protein